MCLKNPGGPNYRVNASVNNIREFVVYPPSRYPALPLERAPKSRMLRARPSNVVAHCAQYYLRVRAQRLNKGLGLSTDLNAALRINHHTSVHFAFFRTGGYLDSAPEGTGVPIILTMKASGPRRVSPGILTAALDLLQYDFHISMPRRFRVFLSERVSVLRGNRRSNTM